jgi:hypothetical protein
MAKRKRTKGHIIQWPKEKGQNFSFGHCIICPFVLILLAIVLYVLLSLFFWPLYYMSFCPFSTYNTMAKRKRTKGHIIQWPKEKGQKDI